MNGETLVRPGPESFAKTCNFNTLLQQFGSHRFRC